MIFTTLLTLTLGYAPPDPVIVPDPVIIVVSPDPIIERIEEPFAPARMNPSATELGPSVGAPVRGFAKPDPYKLDLSSIDASKPFYVVEGRWHTYEPNEIAAPGMRIERSESTGLYRQVRKKDYGQSLPVYRDEVPNRPFGQAIRTTTDVEDVGKTSSSRSVEAQLPDRTGIIAPPATSGFGTTTNSFCPT